MMEVLQGNGDKWTEPRSIQDGMIKWRQDEELRRGIHKKHHKVGQPQNPYWPFGKPGGGAPNSSNFRRRKPPKKSKECSQLPLVPVKYRKGVDPQLRYQYHPDVRKSIDLHWRYLTPPQTKAAYRMHLDKLIHEKKAQLQEEMRRNINQDLHNAAIEPPWGKTGPGGQQWRTPRQVGLNFLHSLGWTSEKAFRKLEDQIDRKKPEQLMIQSAPAKVNVYKTPEEELTGGIELVPLLARRRSFKKSQTHLPTCDVTNKSLNESPPAWKEVRQPQDYLRDLNNQVNHKQLQMKAEKEEDRKDCRKHFETWGRFWGRPGHGAPRQSKVKENINQLLYQEPVM